MASGFEAIREEGGAGEFTKIKEGHPVVVHLLGEPEKQPSRHWSAVGKDSIACTGPGCVGCSDPQKWKKAGKTWTVKVFNLTTNKQETLQKGWSVIGAFTETWEAYGKNLSNVDFRISAQGSGEGTKYTVINVSPSKFKPEMMIDESPIDEEPHP